MPHRSGIYDPEYVPPAFGMIPAPRRRGISLGQIEPVKKAPGRQGTFGKRSGDVAAALKGGGLMAPLQSGSLIEGFTRGAQAFLETRAAREERERAEREQTADQRTMAEALAAYQGDQLPPGVQGPERPGDPGAAMRILAQNPRTAEFAWTLAGQNMKQQQAAAAAQAAHTRALELKAAPGWRAPVPGTDIPLPEDVAAQRREIAAARRAPPRPDAVNIRMPDGSFTSGREVGGQLEYMAPDGQFRPVPPGATIASLNVSGTEASQDEVQARKFADYENATSNFIRYGTGIIDALDRGEPVFGTSGAALGFANSVRAQAVGLARAFGSNEEAAELVQRMEEGSPTWDKLRKVVGDRTEVLGTGIALAYMRARLLDPSGRVSDKDLEASMRSLGFESNDPKIIRQRIVREMQFLNEAYEDRAERENRAPQAFGSGRDGVTGLSDDELLRKLGVGK